MSYIVQIRRNADGLERDYVEDLPWQDDEGHNSAYWWRQGNMACDCNRARCFARAGGEPDPIETPCGETAYTISHITLNDGTQIRIDEP